MGRVKSSPDDERTADEAGGQTGADTRTRTRNNGGEPFVIVLVLVAARVSGDVPGWVDDTW
eukprot:scaffold187481_cov41-Prasinocladus_malaysianus.AAC.1